MPKDNFCIEFLREMLLLNNSVLAFMQMMLSFVGFLILMVETIQLILPPKKGKFTSTSINTSIQPNFKHVKPVGFLHRSLYKLTLRTGI